MHFMLWKKASFILLSKVRTLIFITLPILVLSVMTLLRIDSRHFVMYATFTSSCALILVMFSIEDLLFSEALLATPLKIRYIWKTQGLSSTLCACLWAIINIAIYCQIIMKHINLLDFITQVLVSSLLVLSFSLITTVHYSDYSKEKQWIASAFAMLFISFAIIPLTQYNLPQVIDSNILQLLTVLSIVMLLSAHLIFGKGNVEKLLINTKELTATSKDHSKLVID